MKNYLSLVKFSHTVFALPFAMIGFTLGSLWLHKNNISDTPLTDEILCKLSLVIICMVTARNAAMGFNRYIDRKYDEKNPRTAIREIPSGIITPKNAVVFIIINCLLFVTATFFINKLCFYLSPVALAVVLGYSYTKRFTPLCHLILGLGLSLAPIGAYLAVTGQFSLLPIIFSFIVLFWVSGFDIIYALQDEEFDKQNKLYSIPAALGKKNALLVSRILHLLSSACVVAAGVIGHFGLWFWIGAALFGGLLIYQHTLVKPNDLKKVNLAFFTTNGIASVVFAIFVIVDLFIN